MRFAVIADIHGNDLALEAVLADIGGQGISEIVNLGDCFSGPLNAGRVAELLLPLNLPTVRGNHDRYLMTQRPEDMEISDRHAFEQLTGEHLDWIRGLPQTMIYRDEIFMCHANPEADDVYWLEMVQPDGLVRRKDLADIEKLAERIDYPVILFAHSHLPALVRLSDGRLLVNPGSVGCPAYDDELPYPHKMEVGHPMASYAVIEMTAAGYAASFRNLPYDHMAMATLAAENGRMEWASGLSTGWLK